MINYKNGILALLTIILVILVGYILFRSKSASLSNTLIKFSQLRDTILGPKDDKVIEQLGVLINETDDEVELRKIVDSIGCLSSNCTNKNKIKVFNLLKTVYDTKQSNYVRVSVIRWILELNIKESVPFILIALQNRNEDIRLAASNVRKLSFNYINKETYLDTIKMIIDVEKDPRVLYNLCWGLLQGVKPIALSKINEKELKRVIINKIKKESDSRITESLNKLWKSKLRDTAY